MPTIARLIAYLSGFDPALPVFLTLDDASASDLDGDFLSLDSFFEDGATAQALEN